MVFFFWRTICQKIVIFHWIFFTVYSTFKHVQYSRVPVDSFLISLIDTCLSPQATGVMLTKLHVSYSINHIIWCTYSPVKYTVIPAHLWRLPWSFRGCGVGTENSNRKLKHLTSNSAREMLNILGQILLHLNSRARKAWSIILFYPALVIH